MEGVVPGVKKPVAYFGVVEKGWAMCDMTATGEQVHSSTPPRESAIGKLSRAITKLEDELQPSRFGTIHMQANGGWMHVWPKQSPPSSRCGQCPTGDSVSDLRHSSSGRRPLEKTMQLGQLDSTE